MTATTLSTPGYITQLNCIVNFTLQPQYLCSHWIQGWICLRAGADVKRKDPALAGNQTPANQSIALSIYHLIYPSTHCLIKIFFMITAT
jgi:hypothetical protein